MGTISINRQKCTDCGTCTTRCPACFTTVDDLVAIRDDGKRCIACGHCVALCPADAIDHERLPRSSFSPLPASLGIHMGGFENLVRSRRSHRHFENRPVPDEVLARILDCCRYSPTGVNAQEVSVKVVRTPSRIRSISKLAVDHFVATVERLEREIAAIEAAHEPIPEPIQQAYFRNVRYGRMGVSFEKGFDPIFHKAPALFIFHASEDAPTPRDDCIIAAHTAVLHAEMLGLGSCYIGLFTRAAAENDGILSVLNLPNDHRIYGTLILGYPALKFLKIPPRQPFSTTWE